MSDWKRLFDAYQRLPSKTLAHLRISRHFLWYPDLLQEAFIGLMLASRWYADRNDDYGAGFRTVAIMFIRRRVRQARRDIERGSVKAMSIRGKDKVDTQQQETNMRMQLVNEALALLDQMDDVERAFVISHYVDEVTVTKISSASGHGSRFVTDRIQCGIGNLRDSFGIPVDERDE